MDVHAHTVSSVCMITLGECMMHWGIHAHSGPYLHFSPPDLANRAEPPPSVYTPPEKFSGDGSLHDDVLPSVHVLVALDPHLVAHLTQIISSSKSDNFAISISSFSHLHGPAAVVTTLSTCRARLCRYSSSRGGTLRPRPSLGMARNRTRPSNLTRRR